VAVVSAAVKISNLQRGEWLAIVGGLVLAASVFIRKTYEARPENHNANINGLRGVISIWEVHPIMRWVLLAAAIAPLILAWIIVRGHELSWQRGEVTAVVAIAAVGLLLYTGVIDRPGEPSGEIELDWSWYTAMGGAVMMMIGAVMRTQESERARKPPGVL
jgi:archaellum biogenesis protein FlaJ (TadC family)